MARRTALAITSLLLACGDADRSVGVFGTGDAGAEGATPGESSQGSAVAEGTGTGTDAGSDDADGTADDGPVLDVGAGVDTIGGCAEGGGDCGCTAVDILFVIDNSGSMCLKQEALAAAFPGFTEAIGAALPPGTDLHVGITTSGFALGGSHSENNCVPAEPVETIDEYFVRPGEGVVAGNGLQGRLFEHDGRAYFEVDTSDAAGMAELDTWFSAAATAVGCGVSSFEFNAAGAAWALHPDNAATNAGFVRDEGAALVLFVLSDEADQSLDVESLEFLHDTWWPRRAAVAATRAWWVAGCSRSSARRTSTRRTPSSRRSARTRRGATSGWVCRSSRRRTTPACSATPSRRSWPRPATRSHRRAEVDAAAVAP